MPVTATQYLRGMRGGAQCHLLAASDGHSYVVKLTSNPQGRRILANEWLSQRILQYLRIPAPPVESIYLSEEVIARSPDLGIARNKVVTPAPPGWHFGSRYPVPFNSVPVFDVLGDAQIFSVRNTQHFHAALVFDKWVANADSRQAIFYRGRLADLPNHEDDSEAPGATPRDAHLRGFMALMIDHGFAFNGPWWDFPDAPGFGLYYKKEVYRHVTGWSVFEPWIERLKSFPDSVLDRAWTEIPRSWLDEKDEADLPLMLERLLQRRHKVPHLLEATVTRYTEFFPNWTKLFPA